MKLNTSNATPYHDGKFPPSSLNYERIMPAMIDAATSLARYDQMVKSLHNSEFFLAPLRNQEAVLSSRMEGTISTVDEILKLEAEYDGEEKAPSEFRYEAMETMLYRRALVTAQAQMEQGQPVSASLVRSIHQQLLSFGRGCEKMPGAYKTDQNYVGDPASGEISFVPIAPEKLESGMDALFGLIHDTKYPILLRTALSHVEFEALHPFKDGNGRVGRILIPLLLWSGEAISQPYFYISRYFEDNKADYLSRLREVSASGAWEEWCLFFFEAVRVQAVHNLECANSIRSLYEEMKGRFSKLLSSKWSVQMLDFVFSSPIFLNSRVHKKLGIPITTAARFTRLLLREGLLQIVDEASGSQSAIYRFEPLLKLVRV